MASSNDTAVPPATRPITRGGFLVRLGAAVVGMAAVNTLTAQKAQAYGPQCCNPRSQYLGPCPSGCSCAGGGSCCWYCSSERYCRTYMCCDQYCGSKLCTCAYLACYCC